MRMSSAVSGLRRFCKSFIEIPFFAAIIAMRILPLSTVANASPGQGAHDCIDFTSYLHMTGTLQIPGFQSLWMYYPGLANSVAVSGSHAFVAVEATFSDSLYVIDFSDMASPRRVASASLAGISEVSQIRIHEGYAFLACESVGMVVVDISDPLMPFVAAMVNTPGAVFDIALAPPLAYLADGFSGLLIYDIGNPPSPQFVGSLATPGSLQGVAVSGNTVFVAADQAGLLVIDASDPQSLQVIGSYDTPERAVAVALRDEVAYVTDADVGVYCLDVSQPSVPQLLDSVLGDRTWRRVVIADHYAFMLHGTSLDTALQIFDVSNPSSLSMVNAMTTGFCIDLAIIGDTACIAGWASGFHVLDLTSLESPIIESWDTPGTARALALSAPDMLKPFAYVADGEAGLQVYSIEDLANPERVGGVATPGSARGVATTSEYAYVTGGLSGVTVVDIRDPKVPVRFGTVVLDDEAHGIAVSGDYAYVTAWDSWCLHCSPIGWHLAAIDVSDPKVPQLVSYDTFPLELYGTKAYDLIVSGNLLFVLDANGLWTFDIESPADPQPQGYCQFGGSRSGLTIEGDRAYVASAGSTSGRGCLRTLDIQKPSNVQVVSEFYTPFNASGIAVSNARAYVPGGGYMYVVDIADPLHPSLQGNLSFLGETEYGSGAVVRDGHLILARGTAGIAVIPTQCDTPTGTPLLPFASDLSVRSFPNPARGNVTVRFSLPEREAVTLRIYDLAGRVVRSLHEGPLGIGTHDLSWNAEDSRGRRVASGAYWAQMVTPQGSGSARILLVK